MSIRKNYSPVSLYNIYKECNEKQTSQVKSLLQTDNIAKELFTQLQETHALLINGIPLLHPDKKSLKNILRHGLKSLVLFRIQSCTLAQ